MARNTFPFVSRKIEMSVHYLTLLMKGVNQALAGQINCTGTVTLTANAATTVVIDNNCRVQSTVLFQPTTAHAGAEIPTMYTVVTAAGTFTIHHANNAQTDRVFNYAIIG